MEEGSLEAYALWALIVDDRSLASLGINHTTMIPTVWVSKLM